MQVPKFVIQICCSGLTGCKTMGTASSVERFCITKSGSFWMVLLHLTVMAHMMYICVVNVMSSPLCVHILYIEMYLLSFFLIGH